MFRHFHGLDANALPNTTHLVANMPQQNVAPTLTTRPRSRALLVTSNLRGLLLEMVPMQGLLVVLLAVMPRGYRGSNFKNSVPRNFKL